MSKPTLARDGTRDYPLHVCAGAKDIPIRGCYAETRVPTRATPPDPLAAPITVTLIIRPSRAGEPAPEIRLQQAMKLLLKAFGIQAERSTSNPTEDKPNE